MSSQEQSSPSLVNGQVAQESYAKREQEYKIKDQELGSIRMMLFEPGTIERWMR